MTEEVENKPKNEPRSRKNHTARLDSGLIDNASISLVGRLAADFIRNFSPISPSIPNEP